jgi:hypothetical protein
MDMDVWDESNERRAGPTRRGRIRRFTDWKDFALFMAEIAGLATVGGSFLMLILSSLGFTFSGSGQAIADIRRADVVRDSAIAQIRRQNEKFGSRLDAVTYLICEKTKRDDRTILLPRECKLVTVDQ